MNRYEIEVMVDGCAETVNVNSEDGRFVLYDETFDIEGQGVVYPNEVEQKFKDLVMAFSPTLYKQIPFYKLDGAFYDVAEKTGWNYEQHGDVRGEVK